MSPFFDLIVCWFWGHDHELTAYQNNFRGLSRGRCIGNSGKFNQFFGREYAVPRRRKIRFLEQGKRVGSVILKEEDGIMTAKYLELDSDRTSKVIYEENLV